MSTSPFRLTTRRLTVRPWSMRDRAALQRAANFRVIGRMTANVPYPYTSDAARVWIQQTQRWLRQRPLERVHLAILLDDRVVGAIGADRNGDQAEIGYWITPTLHGQGMMTEVVQAFVPFTLRLWPIERVIGRAFTENLASMRVLEKAGFSREAVEVGALRKNGRLKDVQVATLYRTKRR